MEGPPSDATLLAGVAERDIGALRALHERHAGWLALRLARRCNDHELVADAVQDTFVAIWQKPRSFRGDGEIAAWRWGIAIRRPAYPNSVSLGVGVLEGMAVFGGLL